MNAIANKEMFPLIKDNKIWFGYNTTNGMSFKIPNDKSMKHMGFACWFTNLDFQKRHEDIILYKKYTPEEYPKYDNYNAINISKTKEIPIDYDGVMGVPITFIDKFNPNQFEIIGCDYNVQQGLLPELINPQWNGSNHRGYINGNCLYARILIKHKRI